MADKVEAARRAITDIEEQARRIKEDINFLLESDERMQRDEIYRNRVIGDRLRDVQKLQEESQAHQRIIIQYQSAAVETTSRVTRSRAASTVSISAVAANIQHAARSTRSGSAALQEQATSHVDKRSISEEDQKRSVHALFSTRKWLHDREQFLQSSLEKAGLGDPVDENTYEEYATVSSLRKWTDHLCSNPTHEAVESLKQVIAYVATLASQIYLHTFAPILYQIHHSTKR
jgi:hypothetical protein